jgi:PAS domain S-box-containing protein
MSTPDLDQEKARHEQELRIQRQIAFASGIFQGDVTVRTLLESLAEGVVVIDKSGTILLVNARAEQMFGYPEKELVGKPHSVLIPERLRKVHEGHEAHFFAEPRIRPMGQMLELYGRRRDGNEFPIEISLGFIETINGVLVLALVSDMTLRKQFETRLLESEEQFRILVEGLKDYAILMLDTEGNVLSWNAAVELLHGYGEKEIIGKHFSCFYPEEERNSGKPEEELKKAAAEGRFEHEGWLLHRDGNRFWADVIITALYDKSGNLRGFSMVTRDITEPKKLEDALRFSNARYRALFESVPDPCLVLDPKLKIVDVNDAYLRATMTKQDEIMGRGIFEVFPDNPADPNATGVRNLRASLNRVLQKKVADTMAVQKYDIRKPEEEGGAFEERYWSPLNMPVFGEDNEISYIIHRVEDVTEFVHLKQKGVEEHNLTEEMREHAMQMEAEIYARAQDVAEANRKLKQANEELEMQREKLIESEQRFASFMFHLPAAAWIKDLLGRYVYANAETERIFSTPLSKLVGKTDEEFLPPDSARQFVENDHRVLAEGGSLRTTECLRQTDGIEHQFIVSKFTVPDPDGQPMHVAGVAFDITERKQAEEEIERLNLSLAARAAELEDVNRELEAFNYSVAHDLRNPLNVISSYCQVIQEMCGDKLDEHCKEYLHETYGGTMRMNRLIEALLQFSRLVHAELNRERVDLSSIAKEVAGELKGMEPARRVEVRIADRIDANGDANLLRVVLANLLGNAWKYTVTREDAVIEFAATEIDGQPVFLVQDNGNGFDMAYADKPFAPFQRLPGAEECRGFGIGLATVERIIRRHGGRVWAEGELGKGATFYFTLSR